MPDFLPDYITPDPATADAGYVVVSEWRSASDVLGKRPITDYQRFDALHDALEAYREYVDGEFARAEAIGIFACDAYGLPLRRLDPLYLLRVLADMRRERA